VLVVPFLLLAYGASAQKESENITVMDESV
jgi:hypothetical protein